jgi:cytochrome P450
MSQATDHPQGDTMPPTRPAYDPISLSPLSFWAKSPAEKDLDFRVLRRERPVSWHPPVEGTMLPSAQRDGFWAVTRHADVVDISKRPKDFCSGQGVMFDQVPAEIQEAASSFLAMDAPRHTQLRKLVSSAFTPRRIAQVDAQIEREATLLVDRLIDIGDCDFVAEISRKLPQWTIFDMIGLPGELRDAATDGADGMISWADEDVRGGREPVELLASSLTRIRE